MDIPLGGLHESPIDLPYVGPGTHEGKNFFGLTVELTPATTAASFKLRLHLRLHLRKRRAYLNMCVLMWGAWKISGCASLWVRDSRVLSGASNFKWSV